MVHIDNDRNSPLEYYIFEGICFNWYREVLERLVNMKQCGTDMAKACYGDSNYGTQCQEFLIKISNDHGDLLQLVLRITMVGREQAHQVEL